MPNVISEFSGNNGLARSRKQPINSTAAFRTFKRLVSCFLIGSMFVGAAAQGSYAMDGDGRRWSLNQGDEGEIGPHTTIDIVGAAPDNDIQSTPSMAVEAVVNEAFAAVAQPANPSYRPSGQDAHKILQDIIEQMATAGIINAQLGFKKFSNSTNLPAVKKTYAAATLGALALHAIRAYSHFALTVYLTRRRLNDGSRMFTDNQVQWFAWGLNTVCKLAIQAGVSVATNYADNYAKDELRRRKLLSGDFETMLPGPAGDRMRDVSIALSRAFVKDGYVYLPTPIGTCPTRAFQLPSEPFGTDAPVTMRHYSFDSSVNKYNEIAPPFVGNTNTLTSFPVKMVADGDHVWMLANRLDNGFGIYRQTQYSSWETSLNQIFWLRIPGEAIDLFPGPNFVFAVNKNNQLFHCRQPCDDGKWHKSGATPVSVAVGPSMVNWDTTGQPVYVWIKNTNGQVYRRLENLTSPLWTRVASGVPPRISALLNERNTYEEWANWSRYYKYPDLK